MKVCVLGSGSKGNCTYVQSGRTSILIDAGFSGVEINRRLDLIGVDIGSLSAILITHEHNDHIGGAGVVSRRFNLPVHANSATHRAASKKMGKLYSSPDFDTGEQFCVGDLQVHPFAISHDTAEPVGYVVSDGKHSVGCCTDTGKVTTLVGHHLKRCDVLVLESNHDPEMLRQGPYPLYLQQRVRSNQGHLANEDAGAFLKKIVSDTLKHIVLAHLSEVNNLPELAIKTAEKYLGEHIQTIKLTAASQSKPCPVINVGKIN